MIDEKKLIEELNENAKESEKDCVYWHEKGEYGTERICAGRTTGLVKAMKIVEDQPKVGEWIPCSEQMPPEPNTNNTFDKKPVYLVSVNCEDYPYRALWNGRYFMDGFLILEAVAWMPLPEQYKPEGVKKRSNADRIRSMTDEELADFIMDISMGMLFDKKIMNVKSWMQSEVEE